MSLILFVLFNKNAGLMFLSGCIQSQARDKGAAEASPRDILLTQRSECRVGQGGVGKWKHPAKHFIYFWGELNE